MEILEGIKILCKICINICLKEVIFLKNKWNNKNCLRVMKLKWLLILILVD